MGLEVQIGADASELDKEIKKVESTLKKLESQKAIQISLGADTSKLDKNIASSQAKLDGLKKSLDSTGKSVQSFTPKIASGSNALTQFSRIAQDAPFGIMGIGNNITATAESFGHLVKETGSAGGALKAVASSILGTGGILLAVSLVTTGLTYMAQNGITVADVFSKLSGTFDQNAKRLKDMSAEAAKDAAAQTSSVKAYVAAAKNINLSMDDRLLAVKKLQDEYPAYFGNLTKEQILNGNVAGAVKEVTAALIAKARAAAFTGRITELALEEFNLRQKEEQILKDIAKQHKEIAIAKASSNAADKFGGGAGQAAIGAANDALRSQQSLLKDTQDALRGNWKERDLLTQKINENIAASIKLNAVTPKAGKKTFDTPQVSGIKTDIQPITDLVDVTKLQVLTGEIDKFGNKIKELPNVIKTGMDKAKVAFDMSGVAMLETLQKFNSDANTLIQDSLVSTFNNLGTAIGEALASGQNVFSAIGKSLLGSLGSFISDMGGLLIKYGTLAVAKGVLDQAIATGGPFAVAAGVAAIGVGIALKAAGSAISTKAKGGVSSADTGASYNSPSQSSSGGGSSSFGGGTVVFEIRGTTLIGVLNNTLDQNRRLGGNLPIG